MGKPKSENVQVILRVRPLNSKEKGNGCADCVTLSIPESCVYVDGAGVDGRPWPFDAVYNNSFSQKDVYLQSILPVVETVLSGYNATIFAYGQSGTGKTYSMAGNLDSKEQYGIIPNALDHIFSTITELRSEKMEYYVTASFVELYNGKCRDLLVDGRLNLELKENAQKLFYVKDLTMHVIANTQQAMELMEDGLTRREVKSTELNSDSSRSHSLFTVYVRTWDKEQDLRTEAKLNLVDLAGSERQSKTLATGEALREGSNINLSLTALGTVIDCLVKAKPHIPYRSSPLTMLLKDGLGGNSRTVLVGTIGPADMNAHETVSTLRFITRAKQIKNKPRVQMDPKDAKIAELLEEVAKLKRQLGIGDEGEGEDEEQVEEGSGGERRKSKRLLDDEMEDLRRRIEELEVTSEVAQQNAEMANQHVAEFEQREKKLRAEFELREQQLMGEISDIKDLQELNNCDTSEVSSQFSQLMSLCTDFLTQLDAQKQWISTLPTKKNKETKHSDLHPSVDDIARGFKMVQTNGVDMRMQVLHRQSFVYAPSHDGHEPHPPPPPEAATFARSPAQHSLEPLTATQVESASEPSTPVAPAESDAEAGDLGRVKKHNKHKKKEKKKDKKKVKSGFLPVEQTVGSATLSGSVIEAAMIEAGLRDHVEARAMIEQLLMQQRREMLLAFRSRISLTNTNSDIDEVQGNRDVVAELLVSVSQLTDELESLHAIVAQQKQQVRRARGVAEKKIMEVGTLKEHVEALRDELSHKHAQHAAELAQQQDSMIAQYNKKTETLVMKHQKNLAKERKHRETLERKIHSLEDQLADLERDYDVKIMEYEALHADFEQVKMDSMKRFKEMGGLQTLNSNGSTDRLRAIVNAELVQNRLTGKNQLLKVEGALPMPNSAPEEGSKSLPLPAVNAPRTPSSTFSKNMLEIPRR